MSCEQCSSTSNTVESLQQPHRLRPAPAYVTLTVTASCLLTPFRSTDRYSDRPADIPVCRSTFTVFLPGIYVIESELLPYTQFTQVLPALFHNPATGSGETLASPVRRDPSARHVVSRPWTWSWSCGNSFQPWPTRTVAEDISSQILWHRISSVCALVVNFKTFSAVRLSVSPGSTFSEHPRKMLGR